MRPPVATRSLPLSPPRRRRTRFYTVLRQVGAGPVRRRRSFFPQPARPAVQYPDTVQALLGHFLRTPRHGVTFTRIRVREGHFTTMLAAARALPRVQFVESGHAQPVRVLFADPCIGGGVLYKKGAQEEALLRETPSLLAVMPLAMYLECGDSVSQAQEALVLAAEGGPTFVALDAARFQVLMPPSCCGPVQ